MVKIKKQSYVVKVQEDHLEKAVNATPDVKGSFHRGLGALSASDKTKIHVPDTSKLTGSLDIDSTTKNLYPEDNRWDYAIEYDNETFFIEIHPGSTGEVSKVIAKLSWLKEWLKTKAPEINNIKAKNKAAYHWVYTNKYSILPNSKYALMLSKNGIKPTKVWDYDKI